MKVDKFIDDLEAFLKTKPAEHELAEWLDTYSVTKVELAMVVEYLRDMEKMPAEMFRDIMDKAHEKADKE